MQNYVSLWVHLIWSTKNREAFIHPSWKWKLYKYIQNYCESKDYHLDFINGMPDHLHLLVSPKPHISISNIVRDIKRDSYFWIIENGFCGDEFGWQDGFGAISVSPSQLPVVRKYIQNQEKHHQETDFVREWENLQSIAKLK